MAEELNVGSIVAEIRLKTEQLEAGVEKVVDALNEIGRKGEEAANKILPVDKAFDSAAKTAETTGAEIGSVLDTVGEKSRETAEKITPIDKAFDGAAKTAETTGTKIVNTFKGTEKAADNAVDSFNAINSAISSPIVDKYTDKMQKLGAQLEAQRANTDRLSAEIDSLSAGLRGLEGFDAEKIFPKEIAAEEASLQKEREIEAQIKAVIAAREKEAQTTVSTATKTVTAQENVVKTQKDVTKSTGGANMALDTGATALRAVTSAAGGSISQLGYLGTELMYLKRSMQAAQTASAAFATVLSFGLMAAVTIISMGISKLQEAEQKRQQAFDEGVENLKKYSEEITNLQKNLSVLKDNTSTTEQLTTARNNLTSTFDSLIVGYTDEGVAILATNELLEKQIEHLKEIAKYNRQDIIENGKTDFDNLRNYQSTYQEYNGTKTSIDGKSRLQVLIDDLNEANKIDQNNINEMENWIWERTGDYGKQYDNVLETFNAVKNGISASIDGIQKKLSDSYSISKDLIEKAPDYIKAVFDESLTSIGKSTENLTQKESTVFNNLFLELVDGVVNGSTSIDEATKKIIDTMSDTEKIDALYNTLTSSAENASIAAEELAKAYENVSSAASSALGGMSSAQSDLAGAYAELAENGALAQNTINSLLAKYPELIDYVDSSNGSLSVNADTLRAIYEIQKQQQITELEGAKAKLSLNDSIIQANIQRAKSEIEVWKAELLSSGGDSYSARMLREAEDALKSYTDEYETQLSRINKVIDYLSNTELNLNLDSTGSDDYASKLEKINSAVTEAIKNQYEKQRQIEEARIKGSIEGWNNWEKSTVASIQAQIDALGELQEQQESQSAAAEYYQKSQELMLKIAYEKDGYQRGQLQKELNRLSEEENKRRQAEETAARKKALQEQLEGTKSTADARREALQNELDTINENYDALTSELSLRAQAEKVLMEESQSDIVKLIKSYAPEYELAGETIGERLYNGLKSKVDSISSYIEGIIGGISAYQSKVAAIATKAADDFDAAYQKKEQRSVASVGSAAKTVNYTSNFYQPIESPVDTKRAILSTSGNIAKLLQ